MAQGPWVVGTAADVAEAIASVASLLGGLVDLVIFPAMPGGQVLARQGADDPVRGGSHAAAERF